MQRPYDGDRDKGFTSDLNYEFSTVDYDSLTKPDKDIGVMLCDVLKGNHGGLADAEDPIRFSESGLRTKISHRLMVSDKHKFHGDVLTQERGAQVIGIHDEHVAKQVPACVMTAPCGALTRRKAAEHVATTVRKFMGGHKGEWALPDGVVRFENLMLLYLVHVSHGSWQPVLAYFCDEPLY